MWLAVAFVLAGTAQSVWLYSGIAQRFARPLDGGRTFRSRRLFGDNKTWRGFVVMIPAVGIAFVLLGVVVVMADNDVRGLWPLAIWQYGLLGCWVGLGFMLAELPNSFLKRQLDVAPGQMPHPLWIRAACFVLDQVDSVMGALIALSVFVAVPWKTWLLLLVLGSTIHWIFNLVLFMLGAKKRPA